MFKEFPFYSSYQFASNNPVLAVDLEGLESSNIKNKTETKTSQKNDDSKTLDPKTVGRNFDNSNYISNKNPLTKNGSDSFEPKPQDDQDANAMEHDMSDATFSNRTSQGLKADAKFIYNSAKNVAKKLENDLVLPIVGLNPVVGLTPNKDNTLGKDLSARTAYKRSAPSGTFLALWTATKVILAVTVDPVIATYDSTVDFIDEVKYETMKGINDFNNWSPH